MSNQIDIILALKSANALQELNSFMESSVNSIKRLAEEALAAWVSVEGLHKLIDFEKDALKLEESIGRLNKISGISVGTIAAMRVAATETGLSFDSLNTDLGKFSQMVYEAATTGGKAADAFRIMGISLVNTDGTLRSSDTIFREFVERMSHMADGPQKAAFAMAVMGRGAREAIPFLNAAAEALHGVETPISEESVLKATEFNKTMREIGEAIENLFISLANKLLPTLQMAADRMKELATQAGSNSAIFTSMVGTFKGLVTIVAVAGLAFYDLGMYIGRAASLFVDNFNVAVETAKNLLRDLAKLLMDEANLVMDLAKSIVALVEAQGAAMSGDFAGAKDILVGQFDSLKVDVLRIGRDIGKGASDIIHGVTKVAKNNFEFLSDYTVDVMGQWTKMADFLKTLWSDEPSKKTAHSDSNSSPVVPISQDSIKNLSTLQQIIAAIYKQEQQLIESNPFETQAEKAKELLPLLERQRDMLLEEYDAAQRQLSNPNLSEAQKLQLMKELVRMQGELNSLKTKEQQLDLSLAAQMKMAIIQISNEWGVMAQRIASLFKNTVNGAINTISSNLTAVIMQTKTWAQALTNIGTSVLTMIIEGIIKMGLQWVATQLMMLVSGKAMAAAGVAANAGIAAAQSAIWATPATLAAISSYGAAAAEAPGLIAIAEAATLAESVFRERGGPVEAGRPYIVGERRAELFVPNQSGYILPSVPAAQAPGAGGGYNTSVNLAFHGGKAEAEKWAKSQEGQTFIVDTNRKNVRRITRA